MGNAEASILETHTKCSVEFQHVKTYSVKIPQRAYLKYNVNVIPCWHCRVQLKVLSNVSSSY